MSSGNFPVNRLLSVTNTPCMDDCMDKKPISLSYNQCNEHHQQTDKEMLPTSIMLLNLAAWV